MLPVMARKKLPARIDPGDVGNYGSTNHGRPGSHENSHEKLGGFRARINTGDPSELESGGEKDGRTE
jgi:hypothetical protein